MIVYGNVLEILLVVSIKKFKFFRFLSLIGIEFEKELFDKFSWVKVERFFSWGGRKFVSLLLDVMKNCVLMRLFIDVGNVFVRLL